VVIHSKLEVKTKVKSKKIGSTIFSCQGRHRIWLSKRASFMGVWHELLIFVYSKQFTVNKRIFAP
jgi:hypothetical protein